MKYVFPCICLFWWLTFTSCQKTEIYGTYDFNTLGTAAHDMLTANSYGTLQVEIEYMPGFAADTATIINLTTFLNTYINKPAGIQVFQRPIQASGKASLTLKEIVNIEKYNRTIFTGNGIMTIYLLITDGYYTAANIFATSYWNTSSCIFGKTVNDNAGGPGQVTRTTLLSTVMQHEMGHLLGLVNQGSPMQENHLDATNGAHCSITNCLMYFEIENSAGAAMNQIPSLDAACINDLKANGGK